MTGGRALWLIACLAFLCMVGIAGMLLADGMLDVFFFLLAAAPLGAGLACRWHMRTGAVETVAPRPSAEGQALLPGREQWWWGRLSLPAKIFLAVVTALLVVALLVLVLPMKAHPVGPFVPTQSEQAELDLYRQPEAWFIERLAAPRIVVAGDALDAKFQYLAEQRGNSTNAT